jgi:hypothetical protein
MKSSKTTKSHKGMKNKLARFFRIELGYAAFQSKL